jgi:Protein tyrosine/serine phosphatase
MLRISATILSTAFVWGAYSPADLSAQKTGRSKLAHFEKVDEGVYKGSRPRTDADYRYLQSLDVKYILDLQFLPFLQRAERKKAKRYGMQLMLVRINASPVPPSEKHIASIMAILRDRRYRPIYFHCALGRDRTALVAALYKMYFMGMSQREAWIYMKEAGFKESWLRNGLKRYLWKHPNLPASVAPAASLRPDVGQL